MQNTNTLSRGSIVAPGTNSHKAYMTLGPYEGQPLVEWKRSVRLVTIESLDPRLRPYVECEDILVGHFPMEGQWWVLCIKPLGISSSQLVSQIRWSNKEQIHLLLRIQFDIPAVALRLDGERVETRSVSDIMLTVNPHQAIGQETTPRVDGIHTHVFRVLPTSKFLRSLAGSPDTHFYSWSLQFSNEEMIAILRNFATDSEKIAGNHLFYYESLNCSYYLWQSIMKSIKIMESVNKAEIEEWTQLSRRGKWGVELAKKLSLQPRPSFFFSDISQWKQETYRSLIAFIAVNTPENFPIKNGLKLSVPPKRNPVLEAMYKNDLVDQHWLPYFLGDKLLVGELIEKYLGADHFQEYHPKSRGIIHLLLKNHCVEKKSGKLLADRKQVQEIFQREFPQDFIVKKVMDANSGNSRIFTSEEFLVDLFSHQGQVYQPDHLKAPLFGDQYGKFAIVTGERFFAMGKILGTRISSKNSKQCEEFEYRAHSLSNILVDNGAQNRWDHFDRPDVAQECQNFLARFILKMPVGFLWRQALSFDIARQPNGEKRLIELNTNRGRKRHWSDFLRDPKILGAHIRSIEKEWGWNFVGVSGQVLREGHGNIKNHIISEVLYFEWKVKNEAHDPEYIFHSLKNENVNLLQAASKYPREHHNQASGYLKNLKEFADGYIQRILQVESFSDPAWRNLCLWIRQLESKALPELPRKSVLSSLSSSEASY